MKDLVDTTEMYLRTIFELREEGITPMRARIAERLDHSGPTVSQTVARMERDGLVTVGEDRRLALTDEGSRYATRVMRKHRLAELLLTEVIGLEWEFVHEEACRWEHVMSDQVERKIVALLGEHRESPYGNPIPGLDELLGEEGPDDFREGLASLTEVAVNAIEGPHVVRRLGEPVQGDEGALALLTAAEIRPNERVDVFDDADRIVIVREGQPRSEGVSLPLDVASHVFVGRP
ncbi:metal-dependent transcriptional regulator [Marihabitans asiaticum]|uniref:DtxR family iron (Metal) dependent repressor n=1 Tax=Marihabitans asiaticum TaxID=415218 RepID=A0A560WHD4_9MICO|nr:metal-dependent transcriptional regulator [Marihabitans asiaticum]TWD17087.1 DtxR family iron (metal) dependent repressor [Marihabitans asiaticum]